MQYALLSLPFSLTRESLATQLKTVVKKMRRNMTTAVNMMTDVTRAINATRAQVKEATEAGGLSPEDK